MTNDAVDAYVTAVRVWPRSTTCCQTSKPNVDGRPDMAAHRRAALPPRQRRLARRTRYASASGGTWKLIAPKCAGRLDQPNLCAAMVRPSRDSRQLPQRDPAVHQAGHQLTEASVMPSDAEAHEVACRQRKWSSARPENSAQFAPLRYGGVLASARTSPLSFSKADGRAFARRETGYHCRRWRGPHAMDRSTRGSVRRAPGLATCDFTQTSQSFANRLW